MLKPVSLLGLAVILGLALFSFAGGARTPGVMAQEGVAKDCHTVEIALDEGYGVTRHSLRPSCQK